ncbi:MAG: T9SS type A sorting domain-containing protein [Flavobacteriales bacterium]|nr:T9SS type A sorting domain-containing protein [Flavobacteriales bacterium]
MKKIFNTVILSLTTILMIAADGDTTWVNLTESHLDWYGRKDQQVVFPDNGTSYQRVMMYATIGCPTGGCSGWDYTTKMEIRYKTGEIDSTEIFLNSFQANGVNYDTINFNTDTTYTYFFNLGNGTTDSTANSLLQVVNFGVSQNSSFAIDTSYFWPADYWNYIYDGTGTITDSAIVVGDSTAYATQLSYYNIFDVIENYELARIITPYGSYYSNTWKHTWLFDVSDFEPLLHDTTIISSFYGGWQDGFTMTLKFAFIEGTPAREVLSIENVYSSGMGGFTYGEVGNPDVIEESLVPIQVDYDATSSAGKLRVTHSGHSFGGNENCAEFCQKNYYIKVGAFNQFTQLVWRDDCGMNPLYRQSGTWIYDRANWCPGEVCITREHDLTPFVTPGTTINLDMDMDTYNYNGAAGFTPIYIIESQFIQYGTKNYTNDASVERIVAPNKISYFNRYNPICGKPIIRIKNGGSATLTTATITYGAQGSSKLNYQWTGSLGFLEEAEIELPVNAWANWAQGDVSGVFEAEISNPNGVADENSSNNKQFSYYETPPVWSSDFYIWYQSNNAASETSYSITDSQGSIVFQSTATTNSTIYKDTMDLAPGCYQFKIKDTDCDGISFFNNSDGNGFCRIMENDGAFSIINTFEPDFGCEISQWFTVGYTLGNNKSKKVETELQLFPNPTNGIINLGAIVQDYQNVELLIFSTLGNLVYSEQRKLTSNFNTQIDLSNQPTGLYFVTLKTESETITKKIALTK